MTSPKYTCNALDESKIFRRISSYVIEIAKQSVNKTGTVYLSPKNYYVSQLFYPLIEVCNKINNLYLALLLFGHYPQLPSLRNNISRERYINFHIEYFYISLISVFDTMLHLTNFVYKLGLPDRFVQKEIILNNDNLPKNCKDLLIKINKYLEQYRTLQNKIKHKESLRIVGLDKAATVEYISKTISKQSERSKLIMATKFYYSNYIDIEKSELKTTIFDIENFYKELLEIIYTRIDYDLTKY
jgi:hypothetical protein